MLSLQIHSLLVKDQDPPHRHRVVVERDFKAEGRPTLTRVKVAANWPENKWYVSAFNLHSGLRSSRSIATSSKSVADQWIYAVVSGQVELECLEGYVRLVPVSAIRSYTRSH